jgi:hypothetical protein
MTDRAQIINRVKSDWSWAAVVLAVCLAGGTNVYGQPVIDTIIPNNYHYQVYNNWCGSASIEMMLDCPAVTGANTWLSTSSFADALAVPAGGLRPTPTFNNIGGINYVANNMQAFIYGLNHGANTFNGQGYSNPYVPYGVGTDSAGVVFDLQMIDNPGVNGSFGPAFGSHAYSGYNYYLSNTALAGAAATRTIANCMADYHVPAQLVVQNGAHSIIANGVETVGQPGTPGITAGATGQYTITYVEVSDPWTGYALQQPASANGTLGLGFNTWLRYGYDVLGNGQGIAYIRPDGTIIPNARPGIWFNYFNVSPGQLSNGFTSPGYKFTVEPQGPESLDSGDPAHDGSLPAPPPLLPSPITNSSGAVSYAGSDIAADSTLASDLSLMGTGGGVDSNPADDMLLQLPGMQGDGDWLVPYDGSGGTNDVQGALLIDQDTGVIDEATWLSPSDGIQNLSLSQLDAMINDQVSGNAPNDFNVAPEPGTLTLVVCGGLFAATGYVARRRRARWELNT